MRYSSEHKERTRLRILDAAGRGFRKEGFSLTGIDGLARDAGVTSGAFYGHFRSKAEAFRAALSNGLEDLRRGIEQCQAQAGDAWVEALANFYFTERVTCDLADGCALPSLSGDVARGDVKTKAAFEKEFLSIVATLAKGLRGGNAEGREARAIVMMALFAGGVTVARSVRDKALRDRISRVLRDAVLACAREQRE
ncbi:TetR/AcrR family transcriptional regulator [Pendulispora brunnea]|uniref:TetR/AcrR family transcriptional regulator n=1 Tax=Pendulispora brunnea TaxID=2905690 RepID=A0ABZ2KJM3_9BACT